MNPENNFSSHCSLALVSILADVTQADKAAADAMTKKVAKPAMPKAVIQMRQPVASPEKEGTANIIKEHRGGVSPRCPLETLAGPVPTQVFLYTP